MAVTEESNLAKKVEEKTSETKFTDEELQSLRELQDGYSEKSAQFGQLKLLCMQKPQMFKKYK